MKKIVLAYGLLSGLLIAALRMIEYRFLVLEQPRFNDQVPVVRGASGPSA